MPNPQYAKDFIPDSDSSPKPITVGNLDPYNRPSLKYPEDDDGSTSSVSFNRDGKEILIPTTFEDAPGSGAIRHNLKNSIDHYDKTGEHLGIFASPEDADKYAKDLDTKQLNHKEGDYHPDFTPDKEEPSTLSKIGNSVSSFLTSHPRLRRMGEELLTGTSSELQDEESKAGITKVLGTPDSEGSILPKFKQPETFTGGFFNSLYNDFVRSFGSPSGVLSSSIPLSPESDATRITAEDAAKLIPEERRLRAGPRFVDTEKGTVDTSTASEMPPLRRSEEIPYRPYFDSYSTAHGDTERATEKFNDLIFNKEKPDVTTEDLINSDKGEIPAVEASADITLEEPIKLVEEQQYHPDFTPDEEIKTSQEETPAVVDDDSIKNISPEELPSTELVSNQEAPKLVGLQNHGDGILYMQFDRTNPVTEDNIKSMFPDKNLQVTEMHANTIPQGIQRFRVDVLDSKGAQYTEEAASHAKEIAEKLGGQFKDFDSPFNIDNPIIEMQGGLGGAKPPKSVAKPFKGPSGAAVDKLLDAIESAKSDLSVQADKVRQDRARKFAAFESTSGEGKDWFKKASSKMRGETEREELSNNIEMKASDVNSLYSGIKAAPLSPPEKLRAGFALKKLLDGELPNRSELLPLNKAFGGGFADKIIEMHGGLGAVNLKLAKVSNTMKALMSSVDLSAPLKQGMGMITHPEYWKALPEMFKYLAKPEYYKAEMEALESRPTFRLGEQSGLFLAKPDDFIDGEEAFMNSYVHNMPGIRQLVYGSERAYIGFLNKVRSDVFDSLIKDAQRSGVNPFTMIEEDGQKIITPTKLSEDIAKVINNSTGRGNLGRLEKYASDLNTVFWSPRLLASRLTVLNPMYYTKLEPLARKEAIRSLIGISGAGMTLGSLYGMMGAKVKGNPIFGPAQWFTSPHRLETLIGKNSQILSTDFGKARFGKTVLDPWAGFQQPIVAAARFISGTTDAGPQNRMTTAGRFVANKLSPAAALAYNLLSAQQFTGKTGSSKFFGANVLEGGGYLDQYNQNRFISSDIRNSFIPMFIQDLNDVIGEDPDLSHLGQDAAVSAPALFGSGLQDYGERQNRTFRLSKKLTP